MKFSIRSRLFIDNDEMQYFIFVSPSKTALGTCISCTPLVRLFVTHRYSKDDPPLHIHRY